MSTHTPINSKNSSAPASTVDSVSGTGSNAVFQLKGGLFPLTALQLLSTSLELLEEQLDEKLLQAPKFFHNAPIVIDLVKVNRPECSINFRLLKEILMSRHLIPVGIKNGNASQNEEAGQLKLALLQDTAKEKSQVTQPSNQIELKTHSYSPEESQATEETFQSNNTRVITEPVRSGQQIYVRGGDLIVLAPVSHGAELLADGHIHVYATLRGRALAGVTGNTNARIFCQSLEAELISIAGQYKISEDIEKSHWQKYVDIYLVDGRLNIRTL